MPQTARTSRPANKPRLGRGLSSLMAAPVEVQPPPTATPTTEGSNGVGPAVVEPKQLSTSSATPDGSLRHLALASIVPSRHQPRKSFDENTLQELAASIRASGLMQPIAVRPARRGEDGSGGGSWELVAGERRWRAARMAGLTTIPALVVSLRDEESAAWAVVENLQREDLNPIETGEALGALQREHGLTQTEIAERVGLDRSTVANFIRLTELPGEAQALVASGALSTGHAKALLAAPERLRAGLARRCAEQGWTVRRMERAAREAREGSDITPGQGVNATSRPKPSASQADLERRLGEHLGTRVHVRTRAGGKKGRIIVEFYDLDHFDGLLTKFGYR